jgi:hypothetical protein
MVKIKTMRNILLAFLAFSLNAVGQEKLRSDTTPVTMLVSNLCATDGQWRINDSLILYYAYPSQIRGYHVLHEDGPEEWLDEWKRPLPWFIHCWQHFDYNFHQPADMHVKGEIPPMLDTKPYKR